KFHPAGADRRRCAATLSLGADRDLWRNGIVWNGRPFPRPGDYGSFPDRMARMDRGREMTGSSRSAAIHRTFIGAKLPDDVITHDALKRVQVGAQECRHDAGEHHAGVAARTGGTLNRIARNDG